jgi:hypothetical protein
LLTSVAMAFITMWQCGDRKCFLVIGDTLRVYLTDANVVVRDAIVKSATIGARTATIWEIEDRRARPNVLASV